MRDSEQGLQKHEYIFGFCVGQMSDQKGLATSGNEHVPMMPVTSGVLVEGRYK